VQHLLLQGSCIPASQWLCALLPGPVLPSSASSLFLLNRARCTSLLDLHFSPCLALLHNESSACPGFSASAASLHHPLSVTVTCTPTLPRQRHLHNVDRDPICWHYVNAAGCVPNDHLACSHARFCNFRDISSRSMEECLDMGRTCRTRVDLF
jgi:hypothetical protein